ncbi:hypothetical protein ABPG74_018838 [Tetrahymena malaccensis]
MSLNNSNQLQNSKKTVTFKRNARSISSTQFNYPKLFVQKEENSQYIDNTASNVETNIQLKDLLNDLNQSRISSSHSKHFVEDHTEKESKQQDIKSMQKQITEVQNLQEWINLKKFGQRDNYEEQIENILNQNELKQRPDIRVDMIDDIMNSQNHQKNKDQNIQLSIKAKKKNQYTPSALADKTFYKSSDYAKSYITNKNLLNQILQKKMKDYSEQEEKLAIKKETSQDEFQKTNLLLSQSSQKFFKQFVDNQTQQTFKNNDSKSQLFYQTVTLKKLLTQQEQETTQNQKQKGNITSYSMNQLQKLTNSKAGELINKFTGFQNFKRDICKSIIDYQAIKQAIVSRDDTDKDKSKNLNGISRRPSSLNSQKLITLYQPDYPLEKYQKKKNSTQEEKDPFLKKQEQDKVQQYEALQEISKIKKSEYQEIKKQYQQNKERIQKLGLQQIQTVQQIKQIKQIILEQSSKLEENLKQLSLNKRQNNKSSRGVRYSNTDHDRNKINQVLEEDEEEEEQQQNIQQEQNLITFSQFNQDCPPSPLKHKKFSKKQKDKKTSQFETIEDIIEQSKLELKGLEKKQLELNITIERLKEEQQHKQKEKKDTLFELKKLYQVFMKNQENWRYEKIFWVQSEMHELGQPITEEYFPITLEPQSQDFLKQVFLLQQEDKILDQKWQQWKNEYQVDPAISSKLQEKSFFNLLDKMKKNIKLVRQSNIDITVKKRNDRPQCQETLNKLLDQASNLMNQDANIGNKEKTMSEFIEQEEQYIEQKQEIKRKIDNLTKQEVNRLFNKYPISNESSLNEIKNVFYMILSEFQAKRFSKKYQLLRESSAISEQKKNKHIDYDELREKIKSSLNKSAQLKVVTSSQRKKRAISTNINNLSTQTDQDTLQTSKQLSKYSQNTSNQPFLNMSKLEITANLPYINFYDFYGMKTPNGNYVLV